MDISDLCLYVCFNRNITFNCVTTAVGASLADQKADFSSSELSLTEQNSMKDFCNGRDVLVFSLSSCITF
jgi:hypothetical protein